MKKKYSTFQNFQQNHYIVLKTHTVIMNNNTQTPKKSNDNWYAATTDEGIVGGPFDTKKEALQSVGSTSSREAPGLYRVSTSSGRAFYIGKKSTMEREGWAV